MIVYENIPNTVTKEGVQLRVGQVWLSLDKGDGHRECEVTYVGDGFVKLKSNRGRETRVAIRRMHKHSTGWKLVSCPSAGVTAETSAEA